MVRFIITVANDPARRFRLIWQLIAWGLGVLFMIIGAGYLVGGRAAADPGTLRLLTNLLRFGNVVSVADGYRIHGGIMMIIGMFLIHGIHDNYTRKARIALQIVLLYSLIVALMIFGGWITYDITFEAAWWYVFTSFLSAVLLILAPPLVGSQMYMGDTEGDGGDRA